MPSSLKVQLIAWLNIPIFRLREFFLAALTLEHGTPDDFRLALESAAQAEIPLLKRFNTVFDTVIGVAPLLGLLGTILGLMQSFSSLRIGDVAESSASDVTSGIGTALVSTAAGTVSCDRNPSICQFIFRAIP